MMSVFNQRLAAALRGATLSRVTMQPVAAVQTRLMSSAVVETDEEFDQRYVAYFNRPNIDGWEIRRAMTELHGMDLVPEPKIIISALHACRRVNDYSLTTRFLECLHYRSEAASKDIWPYILKEIQPTLDELGINTPAEMNYDKPELWLKHVWE